MHKNEVYKYYSIIPLNPAFLRVWHWRKVAPT